VYSATNCLIVDLIRCWVLSDVETGEMSDVGALTFPQLSVSKWNLGFTTFESCPDHGLQV